MRLAEHVARTAYEKASQILNREPERKTPFGRQQVLLKRLYDVADYTASICQKPPVFIMTVTMSSYIAMTIILDSAPADI